MGFDTGPAAVHSQFLTAAATVGAEVQHGSNIVMLYHSVPDGHSTEELVEILGFMDRCAALGVAVAYDLSKIVAVAGGNHTPRMLALQREVQAVMSHPAITNGGLFYLSGRCLCAYYLPSSSPLHATHTAANFRS